MKTPYRTCVAAALAAAVLPLAPAHAQMGTPAPSPGTPAAAGAVVPQLKVPLGRKPPPAASAASGAELPQRAGSAPGGIDDTVAQCRAQSTRLARQECMDRAGRASPRK